MTSKREVTNRVMVFEAVGFCCAIVLLWLDELLDLPSLLGAPPTPVNWRESVLESVLIGLLAAGTLYWTARVLSRIRYLEGFLSVCCHCRRVRVDDSWVQMESYITEHSEAVFSHGLCPDCLKKHYPEYQKEL